MRIATKLLTGHLILMGLTALVLTYQVVLVRQLESTQHHAANVNFRAAETALEMLRALDRIEEGARTAWTQGDGRQLTELEELQRDFTGSLERLESYELSAAENAEVARLRRFWSESNEAMGRLLREGPPAKPGPPPAEMAEPIERLRTQIKSVYQAALEQRQLEVRRADEVARRARWISWSGAAIALSLGGLVLLVIFRSIVRPLRDLAEGTRAITEGKYFYRLDTSRRDELAQIAKDFNAMTIKLNELEAMKKAFVSHVSHELKAPLASMQETVHLLLEEIAGPLTPKQRRLLELNFESGKRLSTMIANLLDLSRLEAGAIEFELQLTDAGTLLRGAANQFVEPAAQKEIGIDLEVPAEAVMVHCDPDRILQVLGNLMGNAVKFAPKKSAVTAVLERVDGLPASMPSSRREQFTPPLDGSGFALVSISDRGPSVPDSDKERIFEKFLQVTGGKKGAGQGVGLGLAICKIIVEGHQGALWVEDNPGGGAVVRVVLREKLRADAPSDEASAQTG